VVEIGDGVSERGARLGDRVMVHHYDGCGVCRHCAGRVGRNSARRARSPTGRERGMAGTRAI
jgi:D-arabinose 1-dehydrogenase-like Zn-dependent alcohol dehydrogenase